MELSVMAFDDLLVQRGRLERGAVTGRTDMGQEIVVWATRVASVPVLVRPNHAPADIRLGLDEQVTHVIFSRPLPEIEADLTGRWRMIVDDTEYLVIDPRDPGHREHHWETRARRTS
jgi:hypothetical protein